LKIYWNSFEPPIPLDIGDNPDDFILELSRPDGSQATVKRTQINGAGDVWITLNGRLGDSGKKPELLVVQNTERKYAISCFTYEDDSKPSRPAPILRSELKGKTLRLQVDVSP
jgi:hypothetical protein